MFFRYLSTGTHALTEYRMNAPIDYNLLHKLSLMAREATCQSVDFKRYGYPSDEILISGETDTVAVVCTGGNRTPLIIFGSDDDVWECLGDSFLMPFKEVDPGVRVDSGIHGLWVALRHMVLGKLRSMDSETIMLAGHSVGGAVAVLAAADIAANLPMVKPVVYTTGCLRIGDRRFTAKLSTLVPDFVQFEHPGDPVPRMPGGDYGSCWHRIGLECDGAAVLRIANAIPGVGRMFLKPYNEPSVYIDSLFNRIDT